MIDNTQNNNHNNSNNLNQGLAFLNKQKQFSKNLGSNISLIGQASSAEVSSVSETLQKNDSVQSNESVQNNRVSKIEQEYDNALYEYTNTYNLVIQEMMKNQNIKEGGFSYGENIKNNENYYYLNDFGFTQKYSCSSWNNKSESCSNKLITIDDSIFSQFKSGAPMGIGQACKIAGNNIQNKQTQERAWVDIKGTKHVYSDELWREKNQTCNLQPLIIDDREYINIPTGTEMSEADRCHRMNIDLKLIKKLENLNNKLINLAKRLQSEIKTLNNTDNELSGKINSLKTSISDNMKHFEDTNKSLKQGELPAEKNKNKLENIKRDTYIKVQSSYLKYYYMLIAVFIIFSFLIYNLSSTMESKLLQLFLLICLIYILYKIINYYIKNIYYNDKRRYTFKFRNTKR